MFKDKAIQSLADLCKVTADDHLIIIDTQGDTALSLCERVGTEHITLVVNDKHGYASVRNRLDAQGDKKFKGLSLTKNLPAQVDMHQATVVISVSPLKNDQLDAFLTKLTALPDGVRYITPELLEDYPQLNLKTVSTIMSAPHCSLTYYVYEVQRRTVMEILSTVFRGMSGFGLAQDEAEEIRKVGGDPTYGEITFEAAQILFLKLVPLSAQDVFYDLGSGIGRLVMFVALSTPVIASKGIELAFSRFTQAEEALNLLKSNYVDDPSTIHATQRMKFILGDITKVPLEDATVIFMCATCFSEELMKNMADRFLKLKDGLRVVTLKELPVHPNLVKTGYYRLPMTWSSPKGSPVHVYEKREPCLLDIVTLLYYLHDTEKPATDQNLFDYQLEQKATTKLLRDIMRLSSKDHVVHLSAQNGAFILNAYLCTAAPSLKCCVSGAESVKSNEEALHMLHSLCREEPYRSLWDTSKEKAQTVIFVADDLSKGLSDDTTILYVDAQKVTEDDEARIRHFYHETAKDGVRIFTHAPLKQLQRPPDKVHKLFNKGKARLLYEYRKAKAEEEQKKGFSSTTREK